MGIFSRKEKALADNRLQQVSLSAIYTKQQFADFYHLSPGLGRRGKYLLAQGWDITDKGSADQEIGLLLARAADHDFFVKPEDDDDEDILTPKERVDLAFRELLDAGVIHDMAEMEQFGTSAWDLGRAVFLARVCYERKLLTEQEAWAYLERAYSLAARRFDAWDSFARSYIIGRALWSAGSEASDSLGFFNVYKWLCKDPTSPWIRVPLK